VPAEREQRVESLFERDRPKLLEPLALGPRELLVGERAVGSAPPERQGALGEGEGERRVRFAPCCATLGDQPVEPRRVERVRAERQRVVAAARRDLDAGRQYLPQLRDVHLYELARRRGRRRVPDRLDEIVHRTPAAVGEQQRDEEPELLRRDRDRAVVTEDLDRPQHAHLASGHGPILVCTRR
jgi:hypothetical protein